jgi:hypothetical protein
MMGWFRSIIIINPESRSIWFFLALSAYSDFRSRFVREEMQWRADA